MQHQIIAMNDLIQLTDRELRSLETRLHDILDHDPDLTDQDIANLYASLANLRAALDLRHVAALRANWLR